MGPRGGVDVEEKTRIIAHTENCSESSPINFTEDVIFAVSTGLCRSYP